MSEEIGTLKDLNVKPRDVVEYRGREYEVCAEPKPRYAGDLWAGVEGYFHGWIDQDATGCRLVSRASDTPKTWGEMTDAEKGALLLAAHEGGVIECLQAVGDWKGEWKHRPSPEWSAHCAYRVRPEPRRMTVPLMADFKQIGTIDLLDGEPDPDSSKMERL